MGSWSKKLYLSFWLSLFFFTAVAALWLPQFLDQGKEGSIKPLEAAPKFDFTDDAVAQVVTQFPTRPFLERPAGIPSRDPESTQPAPEQTPPSTAEGPGGLPTRFVPGADNAPMGDRVTTRAYLASNSNVFEQPQTTARVLGRVGSETKVRWLAKAGEGWEEILLKDGRSAYVQSPDLSFTAQAIDPEPSFDNDRNSDGPDVAALPRDVESFLATLGSGDLLRAETYLSPLAPRLSSENLGPLAAYVGGGSQGRLLRIELVSGDRDAHRMVRLVYGDDMLYPVGTLWEWDRAQSRWMLVRWD